MIIYIPKTEKMLVSKTKMAEILNVSRKTVYNLIERKKLKMVHRKVDVLSYKEAFVSNFVKDEEAAEILNKFSNLARPKVLRNPPIKNEEAKDKTLCMNNELYILKSYDGLFGDAIFYRDEKLKNFKIFSTGENNKLKDLIVMYFKNKSLEKELKEMKTNLSSPKFKKVFEEEVEEKVEEKLKEFPWYRRKKEIEDEIRKDFARDFQPKIKKLKEESDCYKKKTAEIKRKKKDIKKEYKYYSRQTKETKTRVEEHIDSVEQLTKIVRSRELLNESLTKVEKTTKEWKNEIETAVNNKSDKLLYITKLEKMNEAYIEFCSLVNDMTKKYGKTLWYPETLIKNNEAKYLIIHEEDDIKKKTEILNKKLEYYIIKQAKKTAQNINTNYQTIFNEIRYDVYIPLREAILKYDRNYKIGNRKTKMSLKAYAIEYYLKPYFKREYKRYKS